MDGTMGVGGNAAAALKGYIERIEKLQDELAGINDDKKQLFEDMKTAKLPLKGIRQIMRDGKKSKDVLDEDRHNLALAGAILNVAVYTRTDKPVSTREFSDAVKKMAKEHVKSIQGLEVQAAEVRETIKEVFTELKGTGFSVKIVRQVLKILKMKQEQWDEQSGLLDTYLRALGR